MIEEGKRYIEFCFNERNFSKKVTSMLRFLSKQKKKRIKCLKELPPCIKNKGISLSDPKKKIILSKDDYIINHNILFGKKYMDINRRFKKSPYISNKCKECKQFLRFYCRGLLNSKFDKKKEELLNGLGKDVYGAVKSDYENGVVVFGSVCYNGCKVCYNHLFPDDVIKRVPFLRSPDIIHFLHYLPNMVNYIGSNLHCKRGNITDSPHLVEILNVLKYFMNGSRTIESTGHKLTTETISALKDAKCSLVIDSVFTLDNNIRKTAVRNSKAVDYLELMRNLEIGGIKYSISLWPIKRCLNSGDLSKTIDTILKQNPECLITISNASSALPINKTGLNKEAIRVLKELDVKDKELEKLIAKYGQNVRINYGMRRLNLSFIENIKEDLSKRSCLILCPENIFEIAKELKSKYHKIVKVSSSLGHKCASEKELLLYDYKKAMKSKWKRFDTIIMPRNSLDTNLYDKSMASINLLYREGEIKNLVLS